MTIVVATGEAVLLAERGGGGIRPTDGLGAARPTCLAGDPHVHGRAWCGTASGVFRSDDGGASWRRAGLDGERLMAIAASPAEPDLVWAGTEPSAVWRSADAGRTWERLEALDSLPSSSEWSFPPRPETHHVRWIGCHPHDPHRLWVAVEAGALIRTGDGGRSWLDRVPGGPYDTHELAVHPSAPETLRVAAGDGYYESGDGGASWTSPEGGLEVGYLRSVAIDPGDPGTVVVSGATGPGSTYVAGRSDGRVYRREGPVPWSRVTDGWPDPPSTIAPLLVSGRSPGELWGVDERGVHRTSDSGRGWEMVASFEYAPRNLRGLAVLPGG